MSIIKGCSNYLLVLFVGQTCRVPSVDEYEHEINDKKETVVGQVRNLLDKGKGFFGSLKIFSSVLRRPKPSKIPLHLSKQDQEDLI